MKWFKFYGQDFLTDPKILQLSAAERSCWITLLCYASVNDNGVITFLSESQLLSSAGLDPVSDNWDSTLGVLKKFQNMGMITVDDNGMITLINWQKRQETNLSGYERVKRYREKKRNDNANDNDRLDKSRIDKKRVDKKRIKKDNKIIKANSSEFADKVNGLLKLFEPINPNYTELFANTTQRNALLWLLEKHGLEKVTDVLRALPEIMYKHPDKKFAPTITTPVQLKNKLANLVAFVKQRGVSKSQVAPAFNEINQDN